MESNTVIERIPLQLIQGCLVASIQVDLSDRVLKQFRQELLERIASERVHGVVLDVSGVEVMDTIDFAMLKTTMSMASVMGASAIIVGLKPGIVSALMDMNADTEGVCAALNLDDALHLLHSSATQNTLMDSEAQQRGDEGGQVSGEDKGQHNGQDNGQISGNSNG